MADSTFPVHLTKGEIIMIREALRKYPCSNETATLYSAEMLSADRKMTELLADLFDQRLF